ncbi:MAG TPA: DsrE family protein [Gemmatimonadales bacterium]|nr:DsrE family protein [Gemmatimonadales bacterium]
MSNLLFILNDPPYGTERSYNALRLAGSLAKGEAERVRVFLLGDAASCAKTGQKVPKGYYNMESMLAVVALHRGEIGVCGSCMDARGIGEHELAECCRRGSLEQLTEWTRWADRVLVF